MGMKTCATDLMDACLLFLLTCLLAFLLLFGLGGSGVEHCFLACLLADQGWLRVLAHL